MDPKSKPRRSVLIAARLITTVVSIAGAEGVLWLGGYPGWHPVAISVAEYDLDPQLGWRNRQGQFDLALDFDRNKDVFHYTNWSEGRRATSVDPASMPAAQSNPVLFFGDSYVQGYGLSDADTLPWIVQKRHPDLAVTNLGTSYYGTYQSYLSMKRAVNGPASVVYLFNDFHEGRNIADASWVRLMKPAPAGFFFPYADLSQGALEDHREPGELVWPWSWRLRAVALVEDYYEIARTWGRVHRKRQVTQALLAKMNQWVTGKGGRLTVVIFDSSPENRRVYRDFLESAHIPFVDCQKPEMADRGLRLPDGHPSGKLNQRLADWLEAAQVFGDAKIRAGVERR